LCKHDEDDCIPVSYGTIHPNQCKKKRNRMPFFDEKEFFLEKYAKNTSL